MEIAPPKVQTPDFNVVGEVVLKRPEWAQKDAPDDKRPVIYVTASSTSPDLDCDRMSEKALGQMAAGFVGLTIFLNHRYSWPEDVFGMVLRTKLIRRNEFLDLDLEIAVEPSNPRAMQSYEMMKNGTRAGISVGVIVLKHFTSDKDEQWGQQLIVIDEVLPLEASVCGIPSNQRSWVREAIKSLVDRGVLVLSCDALGCRPWIKNASVELVTKPGWDETENEIRYRIRDPQKFQEDSFRTVTLKKDKPRVLAIMGKLTGESTMTIQALRFPKDDGWTLAEAKKWLKDHPDVTKATEADDMADVNDTTEDEATPGCACGQHTEHMSEEEIEQTAAVRMLAPTPAAAIEVADDLINALDGALGVDLFEGIAALLEISQKAGARHSAEDQKALQACHDLTAQLGAKCKDGAEGKSAEPGTKLAGALSEEIAEQSAYQQLWRLTYAFTDALMEVLEDESDMGARMSAIESLLVEYHDLIVQIVQAMPPLGEDDGDEETTVGEWPAKAIEALVAYCATKGVDGVREAGYNEREAKIAEFAVTITTLTDERDALKQANEELKTWRTKATEEIQRFLDLRMPLKTQPNSGDSVRDAAQGLAKRLPEFSPFVIAQLEK
jgi:HK97 family phage prohead protease